MTRVLVTRPQDEAENTATLLTKMGFDVEICSMIRVMPVSFAFPHPSRSIIVTSKNGVRHGLTNLPDRDRSIFAVGEATAAEARALGYKNVTIGPGTVKELMPMLTECGLDLKRAFAYLAGEDISYDITGALQNQGIDADTVTVYQTRPLEALPPAIIDQFAAGEIQVALFYSPRAASIFEELLAEIGKSYWLEKVDAYGLSSRVTQMLLGKWHSVQHPLMPMEKAMLAMLAP
ncbi:uroporphyrinogen-III synthase [Eilatimonas milleporae]|uniref:Uroporphyrinogen-III synthase n=1 Tax=Eilatimonas milleporae TaxID=911205 RepID=A0A3M0BVY0_9PROT|nr:uroporphyrinogen-III synthase [Eilatimonas milleporae]RMB00567.1 uroporphyrinogen-III synthase [Eilatimonas milleporae]